MKSKNLIIIGIWSFLIASILLLFFSGNDISFVGYIVLVTTGFIFSMLATVLQE